MKHAVSLTALLAALLTGNTMVNAAEHSLSLGYTRAKLDSVKVDGADIKYRFEWGSPWSVIGSFSFQTKNTGLISDNSQGIKSGENKIKIGSLMAGPAWRFNEFFSLYGMAGLNKLKLHQQWKMNQANSNGTQSSEQFSDSFHHLSPGISVGTQINPLNSVVVDLSYSVSRPKVYDAHYDLSAVSLGIGVKF